MFSKKYVHISEFEKALKLCKQERELARTAEYHKAWDTRVNKIKRMMARADRYGTVSRDVVRRFL
jgi:hypothetical protein